MTVCGWGLVLKFGWCLAGCVALAPTLSLVCGWCMLVLSQVYGRSIIRGMYGEGRLQELDAADAASPLPFADGSEREFYAFCAFYESHHWDGVSNTLHTVGCAGVVLLAAVCVHSIASQKARNMRRALQALLWIPVVYYGCNWTGHFFLQRDIPAVFNWAFDPQLFAWGEACQFRQVWNRESGRLLQLAGLWPLDQAGGALGEL